MTLHNSFSLVRDYVGFLRRRTKSFDPADYGITSPALRFIILKLSKLWNLIFVLSLAPFLVLLFDIAANNLGANPIQALQFRTGTWGLRFLCLTLMVTPIQTVTRWRGLSHYRRLLGLFAFFYMVLHVYAYIYIDHAAVWDVIFTHIRQSSFLWPGVFCFAVTTLLAVTSLDVAKRVMGKRWKTLHRWVYPAAVAAVLHYYLQLKGNLADPLLYGLLVGLLLAFRVVTWLKDRAIRRLPIPKRPRLS